MSQPNSRNARRQQQRAGSAGAPPPRDPMSNVYIGVAVAIVLIIAAFGFLRWQQNREIAAAYATPTPAAAASGAATPTPIPLLDGQTLGKPMIATFNKGSIADSPTGGRGQSVDGIPCANQEYVTLHVHTHLVLFYRGTQVQVPKYIGASPTATGGCLYWVHTHNPDGIIHVEAPQLAPPGGTGYNLGMLFDIWGQPLANDNVAGLKGPVTAYVNGVKYTGDLRQIPLISHQQITLEVGTPLVPPPNYDFPPND